MRVLLVANTLPPTDISGVGEQVLQLAEGLRQQGHEVRVLGRGKGGAFGPKLLFPVSVLPAFARLLWSFRPDVVQVHESDGALAALLHRCTRRILAPDSTLVSLLQVSYVEEIRAVRVLSHAGRELGRPGAIERRFKRFKAPLHVFLGKLTARLSDLVLTPSEKTSLEIEHDYGVKRTAVLPNVTGGLELSGVSSGGAAGYSEAAAAPYFLFVGRLRIRKGVEVLLHALTELERMDGTVAKLAIAGDGEHREALEETARALELGDRVRFLGRQSAVEVRQLLSGCRALVVPSIYEGMPLVILEAMENARAVIASRVSGIPEVVVDGDTGWIVEAEDVDGLARALAEAWGDEPEARRRGAAGRNRARSDYRPSNAAQVWTREVGGFRRSIGL